MSVIEYIWKPAVSFTPGRTRPIKSIVLHSTDGREPGDVATLTGPKVSVHWYVTRAGKVYHFVQDADTAYHAGKVTDGTRYSNAATLGIEQEHFDGQEDWPSAQVQMVANLVVFLRQKHGAGLVVVSHAQIASPPGRKVDPVDYPWNDLHNYAEAASQQTWTVQQIG